MPLKPAKLWIVATPLGNSEDLSPRARRLLMEADFIYAEDTRRAARLFRNCGLPPRRTISCFEHNEEEREKDVLQALAAGKEVVLISDAGTPGLADPGFRLVRACRAAGFEVSPAPGPFAPAAALSAAGIPPLPFSFLGFLPRGVKQRKDIFTAYASTPGSLVFFERKDRLCESLALAFDALGPRDLAICREMTKEHEEFITGRLEESEKICSGLLGELTIIIGPPELKNRASRDEAMALAEAARARGLKSKEIAAEIRRACPGWTAREAYALLVGR